MTRKQRIFILDDKFFLPNRLFLADGVVFFQICPQVYHQVRDRVAGVVKVFGSVREMMSLGRFFLRYSKDKFGIFGKSSKIRLVSCLS